MAIEVKVEISGIEPSIWRRLILPFSISLDEFHAMLQGAFAWQDYHLYEFDIDGRKYIDRKIDIDAPDHHVDTLNQSLAKLVKKGDQISYTYDFGDNWHHEIFIEELKRNKPDSFNPLIPFCTEGERAAPLEDCGGIYRYPEFVESLTNKNHAEHKTNMEWSNNFQPEVFSLSQANSHIAALYVWCCERKGKKLRG